MASRVGLWFRGSGFVVAVLLATALTAAPQQRGVSIFGPVFDPTGAVISGAEVVLRNPAAGTARTALSNGVGEFRFGGVEPASYTLEVRRRNFETFAGPVEVTPGGGDVRIPVTLNVAPEFALNQRVMVIGDPLEASRAPGSASFITERELERKQVGFDDVHTFLRHVPGVNIQEEDGYGLRPNIGLRGSGTDRTSTITLMEDGVLIAPAPYAASAAYYFPTPGRMEAMEVRKGSSQIKYGPRTNGGAVNMISTSIPDDLRVGADLTVGGDATRKVHATLGDSYENFGWVAETYQFSTSGFKALDGGGDTGFDLEDYMVKLRFNTGPDSRIYQQLEVKLGHTDQQSDETYLGLADADFRENPVRRYAASQVDVFNSDHQQYQARHFIVFNDRFDLTTTVYRNDFRRNWYKLNDVNGIDIGSILADPESFATEFDLIRGADTTEGALRVRANNRKYYASGVESVLGFRFGGVGLFHQVEAGVRYHEDQEDRFQHDDWYRTDGGRMILASRGAPGSQANRLSDASAWAFFVQDEIEAGRWIITPGFRYENIEVVRTDFAGSDPDRAAPTGVRSNELDVFIPGVGVTFNLSPGVSLFGGIHKGFAPPGPGSTQETEAESSVNYEVGLRTERSRLKTGLTGFFNDYGNLLGRDTLSTGGSGSGMLFNGGEARIYGIEASLAYDAGPIGQAGLSVPFQLAYTLTDAEFRNSFESGFEPWGTVTAGDELPYIAPHQVYASIGVTGSRWGVGLDGNYVSAMRIRAGSGPIPRLDSTDSRVVWNASAEYGVGEGSTLFVAVQNMFDNEYVVARHPAGARPGLPRTVTGGIRFDLGF